jgi:hypothetical protein
MKMVFARDRAKLMHVESNSMYECEIRAAVEGGATKCGILRNWNTESKGLFFGKKIDL